MRPEEILHYNNENERQALLHELRTAVLHTNWLPSDDKTGIVRPENSGHIHESEKTSKNPEEFRSWLEHDNALLLDVFVDDYQMRAGISYLKKLEGLDNPEEDLGLDIGVPTTQEQRILHLTTMGLSNIEISEVIGISDQTVKNHITSILKRFDTPDRTTATLHAVQNGIVEPLLITTTGDFSGYSELSIRERQLYNLLTQYGFSNIELAESMFITEQTVKNHMTSLLRKLGVHDRQEAILYELKRQDEVVSGSQATLDLSHMDRAILRLSASPTAINARYISNYGLPQSDYRPDMNLYKKLKAGNLFELTSTALLYGYGDIDTFISPKIQASVDELSDEQKSLLLELSGFFNDETPLSHRADLIGIPIDNLKDELKNISRSGLPSLFQAMVFVHYSRLNEKRDNLNKRREHLEMLRGKNENPFVVAESFEDNLLEGFDPLIELDDQLW